MTLATMAQAPGAIMVILAVWAVDFPHVAHALRSSASTEASISRVQFALHHDDTQAITQNNHNQFEANTWWGSSLTQIPGAALASLHKWWHTLSVAAISTTVALQLSPMPSCLEIFRGGDVKRYDGYPYFAVLAGATQWCIYGSAAAIVSGHSSFYTMFAANAPGVIFGVFYVIVFRRTADSKDVRRAALDRYLLLGLAVLLCEGVVVI